MEFARIKLKHTVFHCREEDGVAYGFAETDSDINDIAAYFGVEKVLHLEQVHGGIIHFSSEIEGYPDGDGIILNEENVLAVIRTADCVPLFFWTKNCNFAGVIHIGWRGLCSKIGVNLIKMLKNRGIGPHDLSFFSGPAIEGKCYTVQKDVVDLFGDFSFSNKIFRKTPEGYAMDVTRGIEVCLIENGVSPGNITHSGICTFCSPNFPSYRRGDREKRIYNFIIRK